MIDNPWIDPAVETDIQAQLDSIEAEHQVKILLAVESGSRAWGFASRDSDYDVRFIYVRPTTDYLRITPKRDVIEQPINDLLDIGGWDLRKSLQLMLSSNAALLEWLNSPIRYRADEIAVAHLRQLMVDSANPTALAQHYRSLARKSWRQIEEAGDAVKLKTYCYALRAALAQRWIYERNQIPPMDLFSILGGLDVGSQVADAISDLVARKAGVTESETAARIPALDQTIASAMEQEILAREPMLSTKEAESEADALFRQQTLGQSKVSPEKYCINRI